MCQHNIPTENFTLQHQSKPPPPPPWTLHNFIRENTISTMSKMENKRSFQGETPCQGNILGLFCILPGGPWGPPKLRK